MPLDAASDQKLPLRSPYRLFGTAQLVYSLGVAAIALTAIPTLTETYRLVLEMPTWQEPPTPLQATTWSMSALGLLSCLFVFLRNFIGGIRNLLFFFVPVGGPADLHGGANTAGWLFQRRTIFFFREPPALVRRAMELLSPRFEHATEPTRSLLGAALARSPLV